MIYLSVGMILYYLSIKEKYRTLSDSKKLDSIRLRILIILLIIEFLAISLAPSMNTISTILSILAIPSLITIIWLYYFAYKNKRLVQVHPLIISIGFFTYLISLVSRSIFQQILDPTIFALLSESFETSCLLVIFVGLVVKVNYFNND